MNPRNLLRQSLVALCVTSSFASPQASVRGKVKIAPRNTPGHDNSGVVVWLTPLGATVPVNLEHATLQSGQITEYESSDTTGYHIKPSNPDPDTGILTTATVTGRDGTQYVGGFSNSGCSGRRILKLRLEC